MAGLANPPGVGRPALRGAFAVHGPMSLITVLVTTVNRVYTLDFSPNGQNIAHGGLDQG